MRRTLQQPTIKNKFRLSFPRLQAQRPRRRLERVGPMGRLLQDLLRRGRLQGEALRLAKAGVRRGGVQGALGGVQALRIGPLSPGARDRRRGGRGGGRGWG